MITMVIWGVLRGVRDMVCTLPHCYRLHNRLIDQWEKRKRQEEGSREGGGGVRRRVRHYRPPDPVMGESIPEQAQPVESIPGIRHLILRMEVWNIAFFVLSYVIMYAITYVILPALVWILGDLVKKQEVPFVYELGSWLIRWFWHTPFFYVMEVINVVYLKEILTKVRNLDSTNQRSTSLSVSPSVSSSTTIGSNVTDRIFALIFVSYLPLQARIYSHLVSAELVKSIIQLFHMCLLYAFYAFDYRWSNQGFNFQLRLAYLEHFWPYLLGYGLPLGLVRVLWPEYLSPGGFILTILYPLFVVAAQNADTEKNMLPYRVVDNWRHLVHYILFPSVRLASVTLQWSNHVIIWFLKKFVTSPDLQHS